MSAEFPSVADVAAKTLAEHQDSRVTLEEDSMPGYRITCYGNGQLGGGCCAWEKFSYTWDAAVAEWRAHVASEIADAWREACTISTIEQLDALPPGAIVLTVSPRLIPSTCTLELLDEVSTEGLSEANLSFSTINLVFLPHEKEAAEEALFEAKKQVGSGDKWLAGIAQYEPTLNALETVKSSYAIGNIATALGIVLAVFENNLTQLADGWVDKSGKPRRKKPVPMETVFGTRLVDSPVAAKVLAAVKQAEKAGDVPDGNPWAFIAYLADTYLLSQQQDDEDDIAS